MKMGRKIISVILSAVLALYVPCVNIYAGEYEADSIYIEDVIADGAENSESVESVENTYSSANTESAENAEIQPEFVSDAATEDSAPLDDEAMEEVITPDEVVDTGDTVSDTQEPAETSIDSVPTGETEVTDSDAASADPAINDASDPKINDTSDPEIGTPQDPDSYIVVFSGNGADSGEMAPIEVKFDKKRILPANAFKRTGYTFKGWNTQKDGTGQTYKNKVKVKNLTDRGNNGVILYAQWSAKSYSVVFYGKGNTSGKMKTMKKLKYDETYTLPENKFVKKGNTFAGWTTKKDGSGTFFEDGATFSNLTAKKDASVKLYAKWEPIVYTVKFDAGGAMGTLPEPIQCKYGKEYKIPWPNLAKTGCRFKGWYTDPSGSEKAYGPGKKIKNLTKESGSEITFYAVWVQMSSTEESNAVKVVEIVNKNRTDNGKSALSVSPVLSAIAQERAYETAKKFSHTRPDGSSCFSFFEAAGYDYYSVGENIAYGQATPAAVMKAWMNSSGHRSNILNGTFTEVGVGCYYANGRYYWVQCFGSR